MEASFFRLPRNVYLLSICQVIGMSAASIVFLTGGLIGSEIAPSANLATLPSTMMFGGVAVATIPAVLLMKRIGRKKGFLLSTGAAALSMLLATYALTKSDFNLFCIAVFLLGTNGAFLQQYRFAALESVPKHAMSKAVSFILLAGVISGFTGPEIVKHTKDLYALPHYAGAFLLYSFIFCLAAIILLFFKDVIIKEEIKREKDRSLSQIVFQPGYMLAVLGGALGFGMMVCIMTATPIFLHKMSHFSLNDTAFILQSHVMAMFLPSLFTGSLITRFGPLKVITAGLFSFFMAVMLGVSFTSMIAYWGALVFLGIGWNFLFTTSTVLLPHTYRVSERFKAQGINDFAIVLTQMSASFFAGSLLFNSGWVNLNLLMIPGILAALVIFILGRKKIAVHPSTVQKP